MATIISAWIIFVRRLVERRQNERRDRQLEPSAGAFPAVAMTTPTLSKPGGQPTAAPADGVVVRLVLSLLEFADRAAANLLGQPRHFRLAVPILRRPQP